MNRIICHKEFFIWLKRDTCEYPNCENKAVVLVRHHLGSGLNTHVLCERHKKEALK